MAEIPNPEKPETEVVAETPTSEQPAVEVVAETPTSEQPAEVAAETPTSEQPAEVAAETASSEPPAVNYLQTPAANPFETIASAEITTPNQPEQPVIVAKMSTSNPPETVIIVEDTATDKSTSQSQQIKEQIFSILADLPDYLWGFYQQYKSQLTILGLVLASIIAFKILLGVLDELNEIPFLEPTFEIIGIAYSSWFIYRYLVRSSNRQELYQNLQILKEQVLGRKS
ncbi:CAAD domain-containing protein [Kamptonema sp. UHCC 0994]|uniref:CAAD domain-containing protein n=1 Tax=Kamptonema sp. UHCC 0994 TaxID=3031329 RepID=UPI0023BADFB1|nr:CAAD domain-containing protein [Kamptonema sp. UHCC 0994]MDF0556602.1 CAAD domain-containing protein [Kamptonema sp. UHCC 0994]